MEFRKENRFRCDFCGKLGELAVDVRPDRLHTVVFCAECKVAVYDGLGKLIVPKSPENFIKRSGRREKASAREIAELIAEQRAREE